MTIVRDLTCLKCGTTGKLLTPRQRDMLVFLADDLENAEIAQRLGIASSTTKNSLTKLYTLLGVRSRTGAVVEALRLGVLKPPAARSKARSQA